ncbi:DUF3108 domain-containing protein [Colwellia sp. BRX8-7]|uniref:DUF3108 domain-containing protein n=1 Tax=Colwellia sp. BRX8-7 TaxID=2759833 RepID=UPI0015F44CB3|nr:DUF3108 domain-containing protein [Colwellia sp. BRX8-7]MBA6338701.1 DUF3108 domain-containing protein [Colwellia sp. BRX8-7]
MFLYSHFLRSTYIRTYILSCLVMVSCYAQSTEKSTVANNATLAEYTAHYTVYRKGDKYGTAERMLSKTADNQYKLTFKTEASKYFYVINTEESSEFSYDAQQIKPIKYTSKDERTFKKTKNQTIEFDYANHLVLGSDTAEQWSLALKANILDPLLVIEKLSHDLQKKEQHLEYFVYDDNSVKSYIFEYSGIEKIKTPMGVVDTIKVSRIKTNSSRKTHFWLSVEHNFIPFRVEQEKEGKEVATLELKKLIIPAGS